MGLSPNLGYQNLKAQSMLGTVKRWWIGNVVEIPDDEKKLLLLFPTQPSLTRQEIGFTATTRFHR